MVVEDEKLLAAVPHGVTAQVVDKKRHVGGLSVAGHGRE